MNHGLYPEYINEAFGWFVALAVKESVTVWILANDLMKLASETVVYYHNYPAQITKLYNRTFCNIQRVYFE